MKLHKQVYIYLVAYFLNAALSFATVSLLTHYIKDPSDYGIISLYSSFLIFLMPFISGGIIYPLSVEYFKRPADTYSRYFTNAQVIPLISVGFFMLLFIALQPQLSRFLKVPAVWVYIMPITTWWIMIYETVMMMTRNRNNPMQFAYVSLGKVVIEIALTIGLVVGLHWTWQGRLMSAFIAPILIGIVAIYLFYRWKLLSRTIDWTNVRRIFFISFPFIFERLSIFVMGYSDRYFIDKFDSDGTREVGLYSLASQLGTIIYLVIASLSSAYQPFLFKKLSEGLKGKIHKATFWYIAGCGITVAGTLIAIPIIFHFFIGSHYQEAKPYAFILCSGYFIWGVYNALVAYLIYLEKNRQIMFISVLGMVSSLALNAILVINYGAMGAAVASVITYSFMAIACYWLLRKYYLRNKTVTIAADA